MDSSKIPLVICLTVLIVVGVNAALLVALRRGKDVGQIELFKRAAGRARQPWIHEDEALVELSKRVADLKRGAATGERSSHNVAEEAGGGGEEAQGSGGAGDRRQRTSLGSGDKVRRSGEEAQGGRGAGVQGSGEQESRRDE